MCFWCEFAVSAHVGMVLVVCVSAWCLGGCRCVCVCVVSKSEGVPRGERVTLWVRCGALYSPLCASVVPSVAVGAV